MSKTTLGVPDIQLPPTQAELPYDDSILIESARHKAQMEESRRFDVEGIPSASCLLSSYEFRFAFSGH